MDVVEDCIGLETGRMDLVVSRSVREKEREKAMAGWESACVHADQPQEQQLVASCSSDEGS